ncbi:MAG: hypothetical protein AABX02_00850 [archaeon]
MSFADLIGNVLKGVESVLFRAGTLNTVLSSAVAEGIEDGINRAMPMILKKVVIGSILLTGILLAGFGIAQWSETLFTIPGIGFALTGVVLVVSGVLFMKAEK